MIFCRSFDLWFTKYTTLYLSYFDEDSLAYFSFLLSKIFSRWVMVNVLYSY